MAWSNTRIKILIAVNKVAAVLSNSCRFYSEKPEQPGVNCYRCAEDNGWPRCRRSKQLMVTVREDSSE